MDVFALRDQVVDDYRRYVTSFMVLRDRRVRERVDAELAEGRLWPEPRIGLNPAFASGGSVEDLVGEGLLHPLCADIFRTGKRVGSADRGESMRLHRHQTDAIRQARAGNHYVLTTGTGSGKSLGYMVPIVDHILRVGSGGSVKAIVVYPMNALANSQHNELEKFIVAGFPAGAAPVSFARYTGQEKLEQRERLLANPPDILLTNYVMLELVLTRVRDRRLVQAAQGLRYLVLDELHTYRGRQGADVALLVRRLREACHADELRCIGTSATLSTEGTFEEQRRSVAEVATKLFGVPVDPGSVIGETLIRVTPEAETERDSEAESLRRRLESGLSARSSEAFIDDPLSAWVESTFGIHEVDGRLVRMIPRPIDGPKGAARDLTTLTGVEETVCVDAIRAHLLDGSQSERPGTPFPVFAFRVHQFISRGDTVFASLEPESTRHLTLNGQRLVPGHPEKALLPLAFCRRCGHEYYTVLRLESDRGSRFVPRDIGDQGRDAGFLYLSSEKPWPSDPDEVRDRVPDEWVEHGGATIKSGNRKLLPVAMRVAPDGTVITADDPGQAVWWTAAPFRFCQRCGVSHGSRLRSDLTKLTTLGSEGRSTATTVLSMGIIRALRSVDASELPPEARKLLSFTDNRQDAALQAGHFNDFVRVTLLRAALHQALVDAGAGGLAHDELARAVFDVLQLPIDEYAVDPEVEFVARQETERALRDVLAYQLYVDLPPGWRVTQPNLEQCGLLEIDYVSLDELCRTERVWAGTEPALAGASPEARESVARILLDHLRRELAIKVDVLDRDRQEQLIQRSEQRLIDPWDLGSLEDLAYSTVMFPASQGRGAFRGWRYISARGGFGQLLRRPATFAHLDRPLSLTETTEIIGQLFVALKVAGLVEEVARSGKDDIPGYQIPAAALRWRAGDGTRPYRDPVRMPSAGSAASASNAFFIDLYRTLARDLIGMEAREHTAQVPVEDRIEREARFRTADLPVMYCSPTMELGVDIAELNVVNLRNVPPTPANYAQRSGRAGRGGQPALVVTYCSVGSPHDQWFFRRPQLMVSGQVTPPRIDLVNEDLIRAHVHAVWLASVGLDLRSSVPDILDVSLPGLPVLDSVRAHLDDEPARHRARDASRRVLADMSGALAEVNWWSDTWLDDVLAGIPRAFDQAAQRWRGLYQSAQRQFDAQNKIIADASAGSPAKQGAKRLRREAENQQSLLLAESDSRNQSDFYTYRYFASEGFLPGYSFPRLPLSAFIPGGKGARGDGDFVSRARFLAISEFGPRSLIYYEGKRYEITKVILPLAEVDNAGEPVLTAVAKRCEACGYHHLANGGLSSDVCDRCGAPLPPAVPGLFRLQNVSTRPRDRISSNEEERRRQGFELQTAFRFAERNGVLSMRTATVDGPDGPLATLTYGDTATIWRLNLGLRRRAKPAVLGFKLDIDRGTWAKEEDDDPDDPAGARTTRVIPFVEDTRNCLLIEPVMPLEREQLVSLQMALQHALVVTFQLEESELLSEPLPSTSAPRLMLFYEAAEGGAGVLRRLLDEPGALARVARTAMTICHVDEQGRDLGGPEGGEGCEAACYDCLLSYYNQPVHDILDRRAALPLLGALAQSTVTATPGGATPNERLCSLRSAADSELERDWLGYLRQHGYRLPEEAQPLLTDVSARPDFAYWSHDAVVYIDGPWHDFPDRRARDDAQSAAVRGLGLRVIRFGHADDWAQTLDSYCDVFGQGGEG